MPKTDFKSRLCDAVLFLAIYSTVYAAISILKGPKTNAWYDIFVYAAVFGGVDSLKILVFRRILWLPLFFVDSYVSYLLTNLFVMFRGMSDYDSIASFFYVRPADAALFLCLSAVMSALGYAVLFGRRFAVKLLKKHENTDEKAEANGQ